uniref:Uncharacterized protein n=1 Tax=Oryzias latipes TaxID=8090 RepID=A0A3P9MA43_ORYLA
MDCTCILLNVSHVQCLATESEEVKLHSDLIQNWYSWISDSVSILSWIRTSWPCSRGKASAPTKQLGNLRAALPSPCANTCMGAGWDSAHAPADVVCTHSQTQSHKTMCLTITCQQLSSSCCSSFYFLRSATWKTFMLFS